MLLYSQFLMQISSVAWHISLHCLESSDSSSLEDCRHPFSQLIDFDTQFNSHSVLSCQLESQIRKLRLKVSKKRKKVIMNKLDLIK